MGRIVHGEPTLVAGVPIDLHGVEFSLRRCKTCGFAFKHPPIPVEKLMECYAKSGAGNWGFDPDPYMRRLDQITQMISRHARGKRVLDIGCNNGAVLKAFGDEWEKFGVEPGREAAALARKRGVNVIGDTLQAIPPGQKFDVALAIDVVEHIEDPVPFFEKVRSCLSPGGVLAVITGDSRAPTARLMGSRYWYFCLTEHVSFYCRRAITGIAQRVGFETLEYHRISHRRSTLWQKVRCAVMNMAFLLAVKTHGLGLPVVQRATRRGAPGWITARDHMIYLARVV
ncbi:MAG: class I SAM-dependent methyltransferase [Planctomycetes bacterium]|nr:class I SAM-dependent methyltransferase [Planctomycetota bacterium]